MREPADLPLEERAEWVLEFCRAPWTTRRTADGEPLSVEDSDTYELIERMLGYFTADEVTAVGMLPQLAADLLAEVHRLRAERDEARRAAHHLWSFADEHGIAQAEALEWYPWIGPKDNPPSRARIVATANPDLPTTSERKNRTTQAHNDRDPLLREEQS